MGVWRGAERGEVVRSAENADDPFRTRIASGFEIKHGITDHRHLSDSADIELHHRPIDQERRRASHHGIFRAERDIEAIAPSEAIHEYRNEVPRKAGGEREPDTPRT